MEPLAVPLRVADSQPVALVDAALVGVRSGLPLPMLLGVTEALPVVDALTLPLCEVLPEALSRAVPLPLAKADALPPAEGVDNPVALPGADALTRGDNEGNPDALLVAEGHMLAVPVSLPPREPDAQGEAVPEAEGDMDA